MPWAVTGCLKSPASPTRAQPGPVAGRSKPRSIVSGTTTTGDDLPGLREQAGVERRGEPSQGGAVRLGPLLGRPPGQVRGPGDGEQVDAVLAGRRHQAQAAVDVDLAPVRGGQPLPVGEQHGHLALGLPGGRQVQPSRDGRAAAVGPDDPRREHPLAGAEDDAAHRVARGAGADELGDGRAEPGVGARLDGRLHERRVERHAADRHGAVVRAHRREAALHRVTHDPPAVADRPQPVRGAEPVTDSEPVEQVQRVREQLVGGHGVARELGPVHEQHPAPGAGQQRGDGGPGAARADDDDVVLLVLW